MTDTLFQEGDEVSLYKVKGQPAISEHYKRMLKKAIGAGIKSGSFATRGAEISFNQLNGIYIVKIKIGRVEIETRYILILKKGKNW